MKCGCNQTTRRNFLNHTAKGLLGGLAACRLAQAQVQTAAPVPTAPSSVSLTHGDNRADNIYKALKLIEPQIRQGLTRKKTVVIKPNMVSTELQLSATHVDCLRAILEFLKPLVKDEIIITESAGTGPTREGYDNYKYSSLLKEYKVRLLDMDEEPYVIEHVIDERFYPQPVRVSKMLVDPSVYLISAAILKTHDCVVTTLGLKNVVFGSFLKDKGFYWAKNGPGKTDKQVAHGGNVGINYNLFRMAGKVHPSLTVLDGFQGMERNGPVSGTAVDHRIAVAGTDWLATDRVGAELIGIDFSKVGYLTFCASAKMGQSDLKQIEVLGEKIADCRRSYIPADNLKEQLKWMKGA